MSHPVIKEPKELRFTRSRQALGMLLLGLAFLLVAAGVLVLHFQRLADPPAWGWALLPLPFAAACFWLAWSHTRQAFLVISRIGIEIYPFMLPARNMHLLLWTEIDHAEVTPDAATLILTLAEYEDSKIFITLTPLQPRSRPLVAEAVNRVMAYKRENQAAVPNSAAPADPG